MKYLGIDYGEKKIGLSLAADSIAMPFMIVTPKNLDELFTVLRDIVVSEGISQIVVGVPLGLNRKPTEQTRTVLKFVEQLKMHLDVSVDTVDETFSTKISLKKGIGKEDDAVAAAHILQAYLDKP